MPRTNWKARCGEYEADYNRALTKIDELEGELAALKKELSEYINDNKALRTEIYQMKRSVVTISEYKVLAEALAEAISR